MPLWLLVALASLDLSLAGSLLPVIGLPGLICVMSALFNLFLLSHIDALIVIYLLVYGKVKTPY